METPHPELPVAAEGTPAGLRGRVGAFRARHKRLETVAAFAAGFSFDLLLLERIDSAPMLIHQGSYLFLLSVLLGLDHHLTASGTHAEGRWGKVLHFRHEAIHFLFGTLLTAFLVFYFKAASSFLAFVFLIALCGLLIANELPQFRSLGPLMRVTLHSFCLSSYFSYLLPVVAGYLSAWLFLAAILLSSLATLGLWYLYARWTKDPGWTFRRAVAPALAVQAVLVLLYFAHAIPPVPLSLKWIGIYHDVRTEGRETQLRHLRPAWRVWEHGDQEFLARPGDRIYCFVRIFAPRHFRDGLKVRWAFHGPKGWVPTDAIPLTISGGQEEGWRGFAYKQNYQPGDWQVSIETDDGRDVGHIGFTVREDPGTDEREFQTDVR